jgi:hypothetical protein
MLSPPKRWVYSVPMLGSSPGTGSTKADDLLRISYDTSVVGKQRRIIMKPEFWQMTHRRLRECECFLGDIRVQYVCSLFHTFRESQYSLWCMHILPVNEIFSYDCGILYDNQKFITLSGYWRAFSTSKEQYKSALGSVLNSTLSSTHILQKWHITNKLGT